MQELPPGASSGGSDIINGVVDGSNSPANSRSSDNFGRNLYEGGAMAQRAVGSAVVNNELVAKAVVAKSGLSSLVVGSAGIVAMFWLNVSLPTVVCGCISVALYFAIWILTMLEKRAQVQALKGAQDQLNSTNPMLVAGALVGSGWKYSQLSGYLSGPAFLFTGLAVFMSQTRGSSSMTQIWSVLVVAGPVVLGIVAITAWNGRVRARKLTRASVPVQSGSSGPVWADPTGRVGSQPVPAVTSNDPSAAVRVAHLTPSPTYGYLTSSGYQEWAARALDTHVLGISAGKMTPEQLSRISAEKVRFVFAPVLQVRRPGAGLQFSSQWTGFGPAADPFTHNALVITDQALHALALTTPAVWQLGYLATGDDEEGHSGQAKLAEFYTGSSVDDMLRDLLKTSPPSAVLTADPRNLRFDFSRCTFTLMPLSPTSIGTPGPPRVDGLAIDVDGKPVTSLMFRSPAAAQEFVKQARAFGLVVNTPSALLPPPPPPQ